MSLVLNTLVCLVAKEMFVFSVTVKKNHLKSPLPGVMRGVLCAYVVLVYQDESLAMWAHRVVLLV